MGWNPGAILPLRATLEQIEEPVPVDASLCQDLHEQSLPDRVVLRQRDAFPLWVPQKYVTR